MKKQTKNIITRQYIQNELRKQIKDGTYAVLAMWGIVILFILFISFIMLLDTPSLRESLLMVFVFVPLIILCLIPSLTFLIERKKILAGKFEIAKIPLSYKEERAVSHGYRRIHLEEVLVFRDFKPFPVGHTAYELAANGDEYYIVYYKDKKHIRLVYPTKAYEYKE